MDQLLAVIAIGMIALTAFIIWYCMISSRGKSEAPRIRGLGLTTGGAGLIVSVTLLLSDVGMVIATPLYQIVRYSSEIVFWVSLLLLLRAKRSEKVQASTLVGH